MSTPSVQAGTTERSHALAVGAQQLGKLLGLSKRTIHRRDSAGDLPRAVRIGRAKRWLVDDVHAWLSAGAPDRATWEHIKTRKVKGDAA